MIERLLFRVDRLTGNCGLKKGAIVLGTLIIGTLLWLSVEMQTGRSQKPSGQFEIETQTISRVAERQIQINPEVQALVSETAGQDTPGGLSQLLTGQTPLASERPTSTPSDVRVPAPPPRFRNDEAIGAKTASGNESMIQPVNCGREDAGRPEPGEAADGLAVPQSASILLRGAPSAVAFKRTEDREIQKRDDFSCTGRPGVSAGTVIQGELLTGIISGDSIPVVVVAKEDVLCGGTVVIPSGSTLIGTAQANYDSRRLFIKLNRLIIGNSEIPVKGQVLDARGRAGLCDQYVDAGARQLLPAFFAGLLAEFGRAFSSKTAVSDLSKQNAAIAIPDQIRVAVLSGTGSGLDAVAQSLVERSKQAKGVILAYPGRAVRIVIEDTVPLQLLLQAKGRG